MLPLNYQYLSIITDCYHVVLNSSFTTSIYAWKPIFLFRKFNKGSESVWSIIRWSSQSLLNIEVLPRKDSHQMRRIRTYKRNSPD